MRARTFTTVVLAATLGLATQAHDGSHGDDPYVNVDALRVVGGAGTVDVSGEIEFGNAEFLAFEDAAGDSRAPGQGLDLLSGTITQSSDGQLEFRATIGDLPLGDVQPGALYNWNIGVDGADPQRLFAWRGNAVNGSPGDWLFSVINFGESGFTESAVNGEFTGSELIWSIQPSQIQGRAGARIGAGDGPITASQGAFGAVQLTNFVDYDTATWSADDGFAIGGGVELWLSGPGGGFEISPKVRRGEFSAQFTDLKPGKYTLEITSRYADLEFFKTRSIVVR